MHSNSQQFNHQATETPPAAACPGSHYFSITPSALPLYSFLPLRLMSLSAQSLKAAKVTLCKYVWHICNAAKPHKSHILLPKYFTFPIILRLQLAIIGPTKSSGSLVSCGGLSHAKSVKKKQKQIKKKFLYVLNMRSEHDNGISLLSKMKQMIL